MLMDVVGADEQALHDFTLGADRGDLAARVDELVGVVRQQAEVQPVLRELLLVEIALARPDRDVAGRLLRQPAASADRCGSGRQGQSSRSENQTARASPCRS